MNTLLFPFHEGCMGKLCKFSCMFFDFVQFQSSMQYIIVNLFCVRKFKKKELHVYFQCLNITWCFCNDLMQVKADIFAFF